MHRKGVTSHPDIYESRVVKLHNAISPLMSCGVEFDDLTKLRIL